MIRLLTMAGAVSGAVSLSQFPEFSQQYLQRLSGAVDELRAVTVAFDLTASVSGLSREAALAKIGGSQFEDDLRNDIKANIDRYERLNADYQTLAGADPLERLAAAWRFRDLELAQRTWDDFRPAVPVTTDGLICAGIGFAGGWVLLSLVFGLLKRPFRRWA